MVNQSSGLSRLKSRLGCWLHERWETELVLLGLGKRHWIDLCNRNETLKPGPMYESRVCCWKDSSLLTVATVFPRVGSRLLRHVIREFPFANLSDVPTVRKADTPIISIIMPVGGRDRTSQFSAVLASFIQQHECDFEIIVIEGGPTPFFQQLCPPEVHYSFVYAGEGEEFNKAKLMNMGAKQARASLLLFHDADIVVPLNYVTQLISVFDQGWEAVQPIRMLFYLDKVASDCLIEDCNDLPATVDSIKQNCLGGSTAIKATIYWEIGGHDEQFSGWGGEDAEFLQRLKTKELFPGSYSPAIHLWHPSSPKKENGDRNMLQLERSSARPAQERINELCKRNTQSSRRNINV